MREGLKLCALCEESIPEVVRLLRLCLPGEAISEVSLKEAILKPHNFLFVIKLGDEVCGFIDYSVVLGEAYLNNIAVSPLYTRQGVGSALMDQMVKTCAKNSAHSISLEVRSSNLAAMKLYSHFGFIQVGLRHGMYSKPKEDAVVMSAIVSFW